MIDRDRTWVLGYLGTLPGSILTLGAGVVFGVWLGAVYVLIGATVDRQASSRSVDS